MKSRSLLRGLCVAIAVAGACRESDRGTLAIDTPATRSQNVRAESTREPGALATVATAPVTEWKGPGDKPFEVHVRTVDPISSTSRKFGTVTLRTSLRARTPDIGQYPCTSCHLGKAIVMADQRVKDAHQNIKPIHPRQTGAACSTCHAPDDVELLALKSGERASLDHTYRLCAQCHFSQAESWAAGIHGKRIDGWQGRRVVLGCADCHDPHKPALEQRIPFRPPLLEKPRGSAR